MSSVWRSKSLVVRERVARIYLIKSFSFCEFSPSFCSGLKREPGTSVISTTKRTRYANPFRYNIPEWFTVAVIKESWKTVDAFSLNSERLWYIFQCPNGVKAPQRDVWSQRTRGNSHSHTTMNVSTSARNCLVYQLASTTAAVFWVRSGAATQKLGQ